MKVLYNRHQDYQTQILWKAEVVIFILSQVSASTDKEDLSQIQILSMIKRFAVSVTTLLDNKNTLLLNRQLMAFNLMLKIKYIHISPVSVINLNRYPRSHPKAYLLNLGIS